MIVRLVRSTVALVIVALVAMPARGQGKHDKGQKLVELGRRAYNLGHWSDALSDFEKAYESSGDPALLFNLAEAHRQLGHTADASRLYNAYLRELPNGPEHEAAATESKNLGGAAAAKSPPPVATPPSRPAMPPPVTPPPVATAPAKPAPATAPHPVSSMQPPASSKAPFVAKPVPPPPTTPPPKAAAPAKPATAPTATASRPAPNTSPSPPQTPALAATVPTPGPTAPAPVAPPAPAPTAAIFPPAAAPLAAGPPTLVSQAPPPAQHRSKWPVIVGASATGAFAAGAIAFTLSGNSLYNDLKGSCGNTVTGCAQNQIDSVKTRDHAATAFWILAGAAAVATSVVLVVRF